MVTAALLQSGRIVLKPLSDGLRYDLAIADGKSISRVQCKTGRLRSGAIRFHTASVRDHGRYRRHYRDDADYFAVYCPDTNRCYLVPVDAVGTAMGSLRVDAARNGQRHGIMPAKDFEIKRT